MAGDPKDLPPRSTVHDYLDLWSYDGTLDRIHHALYVECRERGKREDSPTAAIIDSQSVKSAEKGGPVSIRMALMRVGQLFWLVDQVRPLASLGVLSRSPRLEVLANFDPNAEVRIPPPQPASPVSTRQT